MDYLETLLRNGWLDDPADKVRVHAVHEGSCPATRGLPCGCTPRLQLSGGSPRRASSSPRLDPRPHSLASGE